LPRKLSLTKNKKGKKKEKEQATIHWLISSYWTSINQVTVIDKITHLTEYALDKPSFHF
jgi:hypothetical protein